MYCHIFDGEIPYPSLFHWWSAAARKNRPPAPLRDSARTAPLGRILLATGCRRKRIGNSQLSRKLKLRLLVDIPQTVKFRRISKFIFQHISTLLVDQLSPRRISPILALSCVVWIGARESHQLMAIHFAVTALLAWIGWSLKFHTKNVDLRRKNWTCLHLKLRINGLI